ncbi:unnamed protein product [Musa acuminata var. zebrina]
MGFDAMANGASVPALISRDAAKKKRTNRSAKLKQCKLDVRREQWLSRANSKDDCKILAAASSPPLPHPPRPRADETDSRTREEDTIWHGNDDSDYPMPHLRRGNRRTLSSGSSIESSSSSVSDAEDERIDNVRGGNRILDDWEAVADALSEANDRDGLGPDPVVPAVSAGMPCEPPRGRSTTKPEPIRSAPRAWRPDDAFRPRSLPSISKQWSIPPNQDRHCWASPQKGVLSTPCPCPICCEDLDPTDSSFFPCSCGYRLCLFCHKRILEADGRCPGCRKQYDSISSGALVVTTVGPSSLPVRMPRSLSMRCRTWNREH